jgi:predicted TIM-barrel fold metal-dependent hydrolase
VNEPLIDVHAHFLHDRCGRSDWREINAARMHAGGIMGITCHVGSILGSWGHTSPTYMPSPADVQYGNRQMLAIARQDSDRVRAYVMVNPNDRDVALGEIDRCVAAGAVGLKLAASRRADDVVLDEIVDVAARHGLPVLHHVWQNRGREWPGQEASDAVELCRLAGRHEGVQFICAHIGGGGDYTHTFAAARDHDNVMLDLSGSGVDRGMLDGALETVGARRLLWGCDVTMETGLAKLRALEHTGLSRDEIALVRWRNARRIFPEGAFELAQPRAGVAAP